MYSSGDDPPFRINRPARMGGMAPRRNLKGFHSGSSNGGLDSTSDIAGPARAQKKAVAQQTLRLSNLPPTTTVAEIKNLLSPHLSVDTVDIWAPQCSRRAGKKHSLIATATLAHSSVGADIDATVSALQRRYLGFGYRLSIHRHLSSAVEGSTRVSKNEAGTCCGPPFNAKPRADLAPGPHGVGSRANRRGAPDLQALTNLPPDALEVQVRPPSDLNQLRLIHHVIEAILKDGPGVEALLMTRPEVQNGEQWAWLWDASSEGGIWYRWQLWKHVTIPRPAPDHEGLRRQRTLSGRAFTVFSGSHPWRVPVPALELEHVTSATEFAAELKQNKQQQQQQHYRGSDLHTDRPPVSPLVYAQLAHLLRRLPHATSKLRQGDVARITAFAVRNASYGAEEIVDLVIRYVENPSFFCRSQTPAGTTSGPAGPAVTEPASRTDGPSYSPSLIGLWVIHDILTSSAISGVSHAWRYRQLFETALRARRVFETLGAMPSRLDWGRFRADQWKRSVGMILRLWQTSCVFSSDTHELFVRGFEQPARVESSGAVDAAAAETTNDRKTAQNKWKVVQPTTASMTSGDIQPTKISSFMDAAATAAAAAPPGDASPKHNQPLGADDNEDMRDDEDNVFPPPGEYDGVSMSDDSDDDNDEPIDEPPASLHDAALTTS